jgi:hypothetical protein
MNRKHAAILASAALAIVFAPALSGIGVEDAQAESIGSVSVEASASSFTTANTFDVVPCKLEVKGNTAEAYGFSDTLAESKVSTLDVLVQMHVDKYGSSFTSNPTNYLSVSDSGWITKIFASSASPNFTVGHETTSTLVNGTEVSDDSSVDFFKYQSSNYSDYKTGFDKDEVSVKPGKKVTLTLKGTSAMSGSWSEASALSNANDGTVKFAIVSSNGTLETIDANLGSDGTVTVSFDKPGFYVLTAYGSTYGTYTVYNSDSSTSIASGLIPIALPHCIVEVTPTVAKAGGTWTKAKLTWDKVEGATSYEVLRNGKVVKTTTATSFKTKKLKTGTAYKFSVRAISSTGYTLVSPVKKVRIVPKAPTLKGTAKKSAAKIKWSKVKGVSGYKVYRASKKGGKYKAVAKTGKKARQVTLKAKSAKKYFYKVKAYKTVKGKKVFTAASKIVKVKAK